MNYDEALQYIHSLLRFGIKPGMERITALLQRLGNPQNDLKFVHIAGTNGKGTVCTMLSEILQQSGYKTGLFTSPYVVDFRERIQINSAMISKSDLALITEQVQEVIDELIKEDLQPTEFEVITAIAMLYFKQQNCDVVVLEVGLGGLLDSTNVIDTPLVSVITSISLDHINILGDTVEKIAYQKCGIIKENGYTVSYPIQEDGVLSLIKQTAYEKNNKFLISDVSELEIISETINGTDIIFDDLKLHISLLGHHQIYNTLTVLSAVKALREQKMNISNDDIKHGVSKASIPARLEVISSKPLCIIDGGHNEQGARALSKAIDCYIGKKVSAVIGMMEDKDCEKAVSFIAPHCEKIIITVPDNPRSASAEQLLAMAEKYCDNCIIVKEPEKAVEKLVETSDGLPMLVCGSFYLAGDVREHLKEILK